MVPSLVIADLPLMRLALTCCLLNACSARSGPTPTDSTDSERGDKPELSDIDSPSGTDSPIVLPRCRLEGVIDLSRRRTNNGTLLAGYSLRSRPTTQHLDLLGDGMVDFVAESGYPHPPLEFAKVYPGVGSISKDSALMVVKDEGGGGSQVTLNQPVVNSFQDPPDLDGDGVDDLVLIQQSPNGIENTPQYRLQVFRGTTTGSHDITDAHWAFDFRGFEGPAESLFTDIDGDGVLDYLYSSVNDSVGEFEPDQWSRGTVRIFNGPFAAGAHDLTNAQSTIHGGPDRGVFGSSMWSRDLDNDGFNDLVIGATWESFHGAIHIFYGPISGQLTSYDADVTIEATGDQGHLYDLGEYLTVIGDHNGDGYVDLASVIKQVEPDVRSDRLLIFNGPFPRGTRRTSDEADLQIDATTNPERIQFLYPVGDVNGDGRDDLMYTSSYSGGLERAWRCRDWVVPYVPTYPSPSDDYCYLDYVTYPDALHLITDFSSGNRTSEEAGLILTDRTGDFTSPNAAISLGDVDGDGLPELLMWDHARNRVWQVSLCPQFGLPL